MANPARKEAAPYAAPTPAPREAEVHRLPRSRSVAAGPTRVDDAFAIGMLVLLALGGVVLSWFLFVR